MTRSVVLVLHEPGVGGATNAVLRAVPRLEQAGWCFHVWAPSPSPVADLLREQGRLVAGAPRPMRYSWSALAEAPGRGRRLAAVPGYLAEFRRFIGATAPELVHANTIVTLPEALTASSTPAPTLLHVHEMVPDGIRGAVAARLARSLDGVAAVSEANAGALRRHGVSARIVTAGIGSRPQAPRPRGSTRTVVGTLATVSRRKGSDVFVAAAGAVLSGRSDIEFRMIGPLAGGREAGWARELRARAVQAGIRCYATTDAASELDEWDVFVLPTRQDPFPLGILEAMAAGLPVIASRIDGVPELVDSSNGILVPRDDPEAIRWAVVRLVDDPQRRTEMGQAGASRVAALFTPERHARELIHAYEDAIDTAKRRPSRLTRRVLRLRRKYSPQH